MRSVCDVRECGPGQSVGRPVRAAATLAVLAAVALAGCSTVLTGVPAVAPGGASSETRTADLTALLPAPADFPAGYTALVLPYRDALLASSDLSGLSPDARINPVRCQPAPTMPGESDLAMISGMGAGGQSTLAVVLTRTDESIADAKDTISRCLDVVSDQFGVQSRINRALVPAPSSGASGEFAYSQRVRSGSGDVEMTRDSITLVAQVGDVRVAVTGMTQQGAAVDRAALDPVLEAAVAKVRRG